METESKNPVLFCNFRNRINGLLLLKVAESIRFIAECKREVKYDCPAVVVVRRTGSYFL